MPSRRSIFTCLYLFAYSSNLLIVVLRADRFVLARTCSYRKTLASEFGDSNGLSGRRRFELPMPVTNCGQLASPIATGAGTAGSRSGSIAQLVASEAAAQGLRVRFAPCDPKAPEKC